MNGRGDAVVSAEVKCWSEVREERDQGGGVPGGVSEAIEPLVPPDQSADSRSCGSPRGLGASRACGATGALRAAAC